ncbi:SGPP1 [Cordylochernes scorpioides]|uniref:SGPP1 n=1 Tax=Cordylochernes scorpioides TaxID=51811 RepID=A0ABY6K6G6_9ARAC|nr:SGPP1 [Cordylochernes scorpioides]
MNCDVIICDLSDTSDTEIYSYHDTDSEQNSEADEELPNDDSEFYFGKDGVTKWKKTMWQKTQIRTRSVNIISQLPGPKSEAKSIESESDAFTKIIDNEDFSRERDAKLTTVTEILDLFGLLIMSGVKKAAHFTYKELWAVDGSGVEIIEMSGESEPKKRKRCYVCPSTKVHVVQAMIIMDVLAGLALSTILMGVIVPLVDVLDYYQISWAYSPVFSNLVLTVLAFIYPKSPHWSPARGDTTVIIGTAAGVQLGSWLNFQLGIIRGPGLPPPYRILWPGYRVLGLAGLRASIGILCIMATRAFVKSIGFALLCSWHRLDPNDRQTRRRATVELPIKFLTYLAIGFVMCSTAPMVFRFLHIERVTMFTEV